MALRPGPRYGGRVTYQEGEEAEREKDAESVVAEEWRGFFRGSAVVGGEERGGTVRADEEECKGAGVKNEKKKPAPL